MRNVFEDRRRVNGFDLGLSRGDFWLKNMSCAHFSGVKKTEGRCFVVWVVKNPPASTGDITNVGSIPASVGSPGGGHATHSWRIPLDRGAWWATGHRAAKSQTWLTWLSTQAYSMQSISGRDKSRICFGHTNF